MLLAMVVAWSGASAAEQLELPSLAVDSPAVYPHELEKGGVTGAVRLELVIDEEGAVELAEVVEAAHPAFARSALEAAPGLRFNPARVDGRPVSVRLEFHYTFLKPAPPPPGPPAAAVEVAAVPEVPAREALPQLETVVRGARHKESPTRITVRSEEATRVAGTMGDPLRAVMTMPGVGAVASGVAYPVVRGSSPDSTGFFLDGVRVPILFHLFLGPSVIHPEMIDGIDFYPGVVPAQFGRLTGGAVSVRTRPPAERLRASGYVDLLNAGAFVDAPLREGTAVTLAGRFSYSPWLLRTVTAELQRDAPRQLVLDFFDYQGRIEQRMGAGSVRLMAFGSSDVASTFADNDTHSVAFHRVDLRWQNPLERGDFELGATWGVERLGYVDEVPSGARNTIALETDSLSARASWSRQLGVVRVQFGTDVERRSARKDRTREAPPAQAAVPDDEGGPLKPPDELIGPDPVAAAAPPEEPLAAGVLGGVYAQAEWVPTPGLWVLPAVRVERYFLEPSTQHLAYEPRLSVRYAVTEGVTLKAGAGLFHQPPSTFIYLPVADLAGLDKGLQRTLQATSGVEWRPQRGFELAADAYFNRLERTVEVNPFETGTLDGLGVNDKVRSAIPSGSGDGVSQGYAFGIEVMARRALSERWFGWVSYSLRRSSRLTAFDRHDAWGNVVGSDVKYLPYALDQTHVFNGVVSLRLGAGWTVGASAYVRSGQPETGGLASYTRRQGLDAWGGRAWVPVDRDQADRLPGFFRVDARLAREWTLGPLALDAYLDLFNLSLSREVVRVRYLSEGDGPERALRKMAEGAVLAMPVFGVKATY